MSEPSIPAATIEKIEVEHLRITFRIEPSNRELFLKNPELFMRKAIESGGLEVNDVFVNDHQLEVARKTVLNSPPDQPVLLVKVTAHVVAPPSVKSTMIDIIYHR